MHALHKKLLLLLLLALALLLMASCGGPVPLEKADVGDYVTLGHYEQDNNTENGPEPIEWLVLQKNSDAILVVSRHILDCQPYHSSQTPVTFSGSSIRSWLNSDFLNIAFSSEELSQIPIETALADDNDEYRIDGGKYTADKIFLLSASEVDYYLLSDDTVASPTKYALQQGVYANKYNHSCWWLRTPGYTKEYASVVLWEGDAHATGSKVNSQDVGVRPAMWIWLPR